MKGGGTGTAGLNLTKLKVASPRSYQGWGVVTPCLTLSSMRPTEQPCLQERPSWQGCLLLQRRDRGRDTRAEARQDSSINSIPLEHSKDKPFACSI